MPPLTQTARPVDVPRSLLSAAAALVVVLTFGLTPVSTTSATIVAGIGFTLDAIARRRARLATGGHRADRLTGALVAQLSGPLRGGRGPLLHTGAVPFVVRGPEHVFAVVPAWSTRPPGARRARRLARRASRHATSLGLWLSVVEVPCEVVPVVVHWGPWRSRRTTETRIGAARVVHGSDARQWFDLHGLVPQATDVARLRSRAASAATVATAAGVRRRTAARQLVSVA